MLSVNTFVAPGVVGIIMPYSQYVNVVNKGEKESNISMSVCIETDDHKNVAKNLNNLLTEKDFGGTFVSDISDTLQTMNTVIFIVQVFVYGFISLISLITIERAIETVISLDFLPLRLRFLYASSPS